MFCKLFFLALAIVAAVRCDDDAPFVDRARSHQTVCVQREHPGPCKQSLQRWYYDQNSKTCKQFVFGGCQGNENNFQTEAECNRVCSEKKACDPIGAGLPASAGCRHKQTLDNKGCPMRKMVCDAKPKRQ